MHHQETWSKTLTLLALAREDDFSAVSPDKYPWVLFLFLHLGRQSNLMLAPEDDLGLLAEPSRWRCLCKVAR